MPDRYVSLSAKEPDTQWFFCGKRPANYGILCIFATPCITGCYGVIYNIYIHIYTYVSTYKMYIYMYICIYACVYMEPTHTHTVRTHRRRQAIQRRGEMVHGNANRDWPEASCPDPSLRQKGQRGTYI